MLVLAKKPSTTTCSSISRSRVVETVLASRLEPREGTAIGACCQPAYHQTGRSWLWTRHARAPGTARSPAVCPRPQAWRWSAYASAKSILSPPSRMCSPTLTRSSSRRPSTSVTAIKLKSAVPPPTSQTSTISPSSNQVAPVSARLRRPGVECSLRLLQQCDVPKPRGLGGVGSEAPCDLIERGRNRYNDLALREVPIPSLRTLGIEQRVSEMLQVTA